MIIWCHKQIIVRINYFLNISEQKLAQEKISIPEGYIPVHIQSDDVTPDVTTSASPPSPPPHGTNCTSDTVNRDVADDVESSTAQDDQFPTPLPFLDEPEESSTKSASSTSGTHVPPNFDITKVPGIAGISRGKHAPVFVGRQACRNKNLQKMFFFNF